MKKHLIQGMLIVSKGIIILLLLFSFSSCGSISSSESAASQSAIDSAATPATTIPTDTASQAPSIDSTGASNGAVYSGSKVGSEAPGSDAKSPTTAPENHNNAIAKDESHHNAVTDTVTAYPQKETKINVNRYKVVLGVDTMIDLKAFGKMRVWIGAQTTKAEFPTKMGTQTKSMSTSVTAKSAKIIPQAPDFDVTPQETKCIIYDPLGSEVQYNLKPKKKGKFDVSAVVELFPTDNCTGIPASKESKVLTVTVTVNHVENFWTKVNQLGAILWDKFLIFWAALVALLFAFIIYIIKRKLKKKTGFDPSGKEGQ